MGLYRYNKVKDLKVKSFRVIWMGPKPKDKCHCENKKRYRIHKGDN